MRRRFSRIAIGAITLGLLAACGSSDNARPDIMLEGSSARSAGFTLTMHTEKVQRAKADFTMEIGTNGEASTPLGKASCFDPNSDIIPVTFKGKYLNSATDSVELGIEGDIDVRTPQGDMATNVQFAWLSSGTPNCNRPPQPDELTSFSLSNDC